MRIVLRPGALNAFGPVLKRLREHSRGRLTQDDLSARLTHLGLQMDRTIVSRIENQKRALNDIELIYFAQALRTSVARICELANQPATATNLLDYPVDPEEEDQIKVAEDEADPDLA